MKKTVITYLFICMVSFCQAQSVGIGTTTPDSTARLEINSNSKGFLLPRMTLAQRNTISNPAAGLIIWCTDCDEMQLYNGQVWKNMSATAASGISLPGIKICYDTWMFKNLAITTYRNGDPIPVITDSATWVNLTTGAMCWLNNDSANNAGNYGALYNWYAVNDPRGLAPAGWHVASLDEWTRLEQCLGYEEVTGEKIKAITTSWLAPNIATNRSGFTGLPSAFRHGHSAGFRGTNGSIGAWWTATEYGNNKASIKYLVNLGGMIYSSQAHKNYGLSVRCVKD